MDSINQYTLLGTPRPNNRSTSRTRICFLFTIVAVALSAGFVVAELLKFSRRPHVSSPKHLCRHAQDPERCLALISKAVPDYGVTQLDEAVVLQKFLINYVHQMEDAAVKTKTILYEINQQNEQGALSDCLELMDLSIDRVNDSVLALANWAGLSKANEQAWLGAVLTNHVTCLDGLHLLGRKFLATAMEDLISRGKASLAMLAAVSASDDEMLKIKPVKAKFPAWVTSGDMKLLESRGKDIKADAVVARDGSGDYRTVAEAVAAAPDDNKKRYVIYVKKGMYKENVEVTKKQKNLMIVGDGMEFTVITGNLNVVDGSTTFRSATLAAVADGFILQDICIQNTAGPEKHQAVALRVGADQSVINRCRIDAYQDTLYAHSLRQFYKDCYVTGTIDFVFGNAAVVFQNCKLVARKPLKNQKNMITAQGRTDPNQNTGTSILYCDIIASPDLEPVQSSFPTFLGRPGKEYSRTAVMESYIGDHIDPSGWAPWNGDFALNTLFYGEYMNRGPGAGTSKRVNWPGFHVITDPAKVMKFTVAQLITGWGVAEIHRS